MHRDIKPENIMLRPDGYVKVLDFGLAKQSQRPSPADDEDAQSVIGNSTESGLMMGTPRYMSPEQARGLKVDGRTDIFSLGVVLWEMCTGRRLFKADTEINTLQKILQAPIPKPSDHVPGFPPELESTLRSYYSNELVDGNLRMADVPDGARLVGGKGMWFPVVAVENVFIFPGVPEILHRKFDRIKEMFRDAPY